MSKEYLEALKKVKYNSSKEVVEAFDIIEKGLQRLESIDNANPSEALECLIGLEKEIIQRDGRITDFLKIKFNIIKQALIKAQENEKVLEILKNKLDFVFFGRTREVKIEQDDDSDKYVYLMNGFDDSTLPEEEFDLLKRWLG